jgi:hypothetical protein
MKYTNPLISPSLNDQIHKNDVGEVFYTHDCRNLPICKSYGDCFFACLAGARDGTRCKNAEKMQIRILNDMNPNAIHKPGKPSKEEIDEYIKG